MRQKSDRFGRMKKKRRRVPVIRRDKRQNVEEKMTEEERIQAAKRFERQMQELDARRLERINGSYSLESGMKFFFGAVDAVFLSLASQSSFWKSSHG